MSEVDEHYFLSCSYLIDVRIERGEKAMSTPSKCFSVLGILLMLNIKTTKQINKKQKESHLNAVMCGFVPFTIIQISQFLLLLGQIVDSSLEGITGHVQAWWKKLLVSTAPQHY